MKSRIITETDATAPEFQYQEDAYRAVIIPDAMRRRREIPGVKNPFAAACFSSLELFNSLRSLVGVAKVRQS